MKVHRLGRVALILAAAGAGALIVGGCGGWDDLRASVLTIGLVGQNEPYELVLDTEYALAWEVRNRQGDLVYGYTDTDLAWGTSAEQIAFVKDTINGPVVKTKEPGTCTITAVLVPRGIADSFRITVQ